MQKNIGLLFLFVLIVTSCGKKSSHRPHSRYSIAQDSAPENHQRQQTPQSPWNIKPEPKSRYGNHSPYTVSGTTYYVAESNPNFEQTGTASWYGKKFHGHTTSNMEIFDMYKYTAAHRTLPLPSFVEVTNLDNNKKLIVRVNDRGPFKSKRIIDLSWAAAKALGYDKKGLANVHIKLVQPNHKPQTTQTAQNTGLKYLQIGAFSQKDKALQVAKLISQSIILPVHVTNTLGAAPLFRVRLGPLADDENIIDIIQKINRAGFNSPKMVTE